MKPLVSVSIGLALASLPVATFAQVTQSYQYDANGRLTGVTTTGSAGTNTAAYTYDDADNRTSRSQTGTAYAALLSLPIDQLLQPNQALVSRDGRYSFALRTSGSLELWAEQPQPLVPTSYAALFLINGLGAARFQPRQSLADGDGAYLALSNEGDLLVMAEDGAAVLWRASSAQAAKVSQ